MSVLDTGREPSHGLRPSESIPSSWRRRRVGPTQETRRESGEFVRRAIDCTSPGTRDGEVLAQSSDNRGLGCRGGNHSAPNEDRIRRDCRVPQD
jgi:hypothetical protein